MGCEDQELWLYFDYPSTLCYYLTHSTWNEVRHGQCTFTSALLIVFLFSLVGCIIGILHEKWHEIGKQEVLLNLYLTYSGDNLCSTCSKKAGSESGFIEEHLYTLKVKLLDFIRVQIFNPFAAGYRLSDPQCLENPEVQACLHIHNCGGLKSIKYEMLTDQPSHLLCLQSSQYNSVFVEENEIGCVNKRQKLFANCPQFIEIIWANLSSIRINQLPRERYFCSGSIVTIEEINVHKKVIASPPKSQKL